MSSAASGQSGCDASGFFVKCDGALVTEGGDCEETSLFVQCEGD